MKYELAHHSMQGGRSSNQDRVAFAERSNAVLLVLADGLGGHKGGDIASDMFVQSMVQSFLSVRHKLIEQPSAYLALSMMQAHNQIVSHSRLFHPDIEPRTTGVACLVQNGYAYWAHVGDSRLYHFRDGKMLKRTRDHSTVEKMHAEGLINEDDMQTHPRKSQITRCIGGSHKPQVSLGEETRLHTGDTLMICSDGVWEGLKKEEMLEFLQQPSLDEGVEQMLYAVEERMGEACDNISAIALRWRDRMTMSTPLQKNKAVSVNEDQLREKARRRAAGARARDRIAAAPPVADTDKTAAITRDTVKKEIEELEAFLDKTDLKKRDRRR